MKDNIKVFAPATVANLACGFDLLGLAVHGMGDEIVVRESNKKGITISKITGDEGKLPKDASKNVAGVAAQAILKHLGLENEVGFDFELRKKMPFGTGLGSSAASSVAGAMAINEALNRPLSKKELLPFAMLGEQAADGAYHADNVAPSLLGGIIFCRDNPSLDIHRIYAPKGLYVTVVLPEIEILTKDARGILSDMLTLKAHIQQTGNLGGLIIGLMNSDFDLIGRSLSDVVIEPQRARLIPHFYNVKEAALGAGALGCSISGAGPSIFALNDNSLKAETTAIAMQEVFRYNNINSRVIVSEVNNDGAILC
jgi:homoserine kinase